MLAENAAMLTIPVQQTSETASETAQTTAPPVTETTAVQTSPAQTAPPATTAPQTAAQGYEYDKAVPECERASDDYLTKCVFIGDSHINALGGYGIESQDRVFAKNGLNITQVYDYVNLDSVAGVNPENIYIMFGTNGVMWMDWDSMISQYKELITKIKEKCPQSSIYILSIPPVTADREKIADIASGKYLNSEINDYNNRLQSMACDERIYYADLNSHVKNSDGYLISSSDGVHMTADLYANQVKTFLLTHIVK